MVAQQLVLGQRERSATEIITMRLIDALTRYPKIPIFGRIEGLEHDSDDIHDREFEPIDAAVLLESEISEFFVVKAKHVLPDGTVRDCYMDVCLPERVNDYTYFLGETGIDRRYTHECDGEVICAVPIACIGVYELFYSRISPDIGIDILRKGLAVTEHQQYIAEDLGYILRDERRFKEAVAVFQLASEGTPSSYFIYGELAGCYDQIGDSENAKRYMALFEFHA